MNSPIPKEQCDILIALKYDTCEAAEKCEPCKGVREMAIAEIEGLRDLVAHCWIHSGYFNCGYDQMTTEQRALYDAIIHQETAK